MISAQMIEDSIAPNGKRLSTMQLKFHRFILPEFNTHRMFSRNAGSSRAIPVAKLIEQVINDPAMPIYWGSNKPGMQAGAELTGEDRIDAERVWRLAASEAAEFAGMMADHGLHKQTANRVLESFLWVNVIVTATEWENFFQLRDHPDAQPEIRELALRMKYAMDASTPIQKPRDRFDAASWHLPYVTEQERSDFQTEPQTLAKLSAARCARVSYKTVDGTPPSVEKDLALYERLVGGVPLHASPVEHIGYPLALATQASKNFYGWRQYRELVEHAFIAK